MFAFTKKLLLPRALSYFCKVSGHSVYSLAIIFMENTAEPSRQLRQHSAC